MDVMTMAALGKAGAAAALAWAAVGSAFGTGTAGMAAIGAWKKSYAQKKSAPFVLLIFVGAPLSQTIYGMILLNIINRMCSLSTYVPVKAMTLAQEAAAKAGSGDWVSYLAPDALTAAQQALANASGNWPAILVAGNLGGLAMAASAWLQGRAGAAGSDALAETGQGFANYLMTIGVVETVALFVLVFVQAVL
jgi:V/A-type H+-transporting ATPase subunit K